MVTFFYSFLEQFRLLPSRGRIERRHGEQRVAVEAGLELVLHRRLVLVFSVFCPSYRLPRLRRTLPRFLRRTSRCEMWSASISRLTVCHGLSMPLADCIDLCAGVGSDVQKDL